MLLISDTIDELLDKMEKYQAHKLQSGLIKKLFSLCDW
jgi:hypothetical protein